MENYYERRARNNARTSLGKRALRKARTALEAIFVLGSSLRGLLGSNVVGRVGPMGLHPKRDQEENAKRT